MTFGESTPLAARDRLIVFVRWPEPGSVKRRIAKSLGAEAAAAIYRELAEQTLRRIALLPRAFDLEVTFTPAGRRGKVERWLAPVAPGARWTPQCEGDLGARMAAAFDTAFAAGASRVVLIGSDIPALSRVLVDEAFARLATEEIVVGPARDGGYYLIGLSRPCAPLFEGIAWGTGAVLSQTLVAASRLARSVRLLAVLSDVDTAEDARRLGPASMSGLRTED